MDINAVMEAVGDRLATITGLRVHKEPPSIVNPPAAVVVFPDVTFDATYGRGMDTLSLPVVLVISKAVDRVSRQQVTPYISGSGSKSIKAVLESGTYTALDVVRVASVEIAVAPIGAVDYLTATFTLDIAGRGA